MRNVVRSEFDNLHPEHASSRGVKVYDSTKVVSLETDENNKPDFASYTCLPSSDASDTVNGAISFHCIEGLPLLVLSSTRKCILEVRDHNLRRM